MEEIEETKQYLKSHTVSKWLVNKSQAADKPSIKDEFIKSQDAIRGEI